MIAFFVKRKQTPPSGGACFPLSFLTCVDRKLQNLTMYTASCVNWEML